MTIHIIILFPPFQLWTRTPQLLVCITIIHRLHLCDPIYHKEIVPAMKLKKPRLGSYPRVFVKFYVSILQKWTGEGVWNYINGSSIGKRGFCNFIAVTLSFTIYLPSPSYKI